VEELKSTPTSEPQYVIPLPQRLHIPVYHFSSALEKVGTFHLSPKIFGQDPIRTDILHRCVVYQRNKKRGFRNPGAKTKTISEVSGSGRKVRNQKGGGVARAGHRRPAHWKGGAKAHGPKGKIQNYTTKLNKKVKKLAILMGLSQKLKEGNLIVVNGFDHLEDYKTKTLAKALNKLGNIGGRNGSTAYLIDHAEDNYKKDQTTDDDNTVTQVDGVDVNLRVASSNLFKIKVSNQRNLNVYDMLKHELVLSLNAVQALEGRLIAF
jgi:large subunit ribosomal protein L4